LYSGYHDSIHLLRLWAVCAGGLLSLVTEYKEECWNRRIDPSMRIPERPNVILADFQAGALGHGEPYVDVVLPTGRLMSSASTHDTAASVWGLRARRVRVKRARTAYWGVE
jgi:hypothetical protein